MNSWDRTAPGTRAFMKTVVGRLQEIRLRWHVFCDWVRNLPYGRELILAKEEE